MKLHDLNTNKARYPNAVYLTRAEYKELEDYEAGLDIIGRLHDAWMSNTGIVLGLWKYNGTDYIIHVYEYHTQRDIDRDHQHLGDTWQWYVDDGHCCDEEDDQ